MPCLFKAIFRFPCPGCGLTRAYRSLSKGDLKRAFYWHPLYWMPPLAAGVFLVSTRCDSVRRAAVRLKPVGIAALLAFLGVWVLRLAVDTPRVASRHW
jgi:hypothetical protein